jgi:nitrogenase molybdenum-iron protein alpha chain
MKVLVAGYQFAHRDDYEGRLVLETMKEKASSSILEDLHYEKDKNFTPAISEARMKELKEKMGLMDYGGMFPETRDGTVVVDDLNHYETEFLIKELKPGPVLFGDQGQVLGSEDGVPSRQIHSYDYSGRYTGFSGVLNFARDVDMAVNNPSWKYIKAPWKAEQKEGMRC